MKEPFLSCLNPASQDQSLKTGEIPHLQKEAFFMDIEDLLTAYSGRSPKGEIDLSTLSEDLQLKNREMNRKEAVIRFMYELSKGI